MQQLIPGLARSEPQLFWLCAGGAGIVALAGLWLLLRGLRRAAEILAEPTASIRSAAQSWLTVEGRARALPGEPPRAPLSSARCVWWRYTISQKGRRGWQAIERDSSRGLFELQDASGSCLVDPAGAQVLPVRKRRWHGRQSRPGGGPGLGLPAMFARYRYEEELIHERAELRVSGLLRTQRAAEGGHFDETEEMAALLADWKLDQQKLLRRSDADHSPPAALAEWENRRRSALRALHDDQIESGVTPGLHALSQPVDGRPFVISATPQHRLVSRYRWRAFWGFLAFVGGSVFGSWLLLARMILPAG